MCGTIKPTNPIGPAIETETPARTTTNIPTIILTISVLCPNPLAISSPNSNIVNCLPINMVTKIARSKNGKINIICCHFIPANEPTNQNITVSLESSFKIIIP